MNLFLISLFDPTPMDEPIYPRFIGIAKAANQLGHNVTHFTSTFRHNTREHRFETSTNARINEHYEVVYTKSMGYKQNRMPRRYYAHHDYAQKLVSELDKRDRPDAIFMSMPPLSTIAQVTRWAEKKRIPVIIDVIDPWPDSFIKDVPASLKGLAKVFIFPFYRKLRAALDKSAAVTAISNGYLQWVAKYHSPQKKARAFFLAIEFGEIQQKLTQKKNDKPADDVLRLIYAGSLGSSYDIPTILRAAEYFDQHFPGKTQFVITGSGPQEKEIREVEARVRNLNYMGRVSADELIRQYAIADLGLIQHKNSLTQTITYKFFNYMSAGLPLLNSLQSEMAQMIEESNLGMNNKEEDADQLVRNIQKYMDDRDLLEKHRRNVLQFTKSHGDSETVYRNLVQFIDEIRKEHLR